MTIRCLWGFIPRSVWDKLPTVMQNYNIDTREKLAHFLGQCKVESNFTSVYENLNYSAKRLMEVFPKYFPNYKFAKMYEYKPFNIANRVYGNRMGNGNELSGDGYKYRGRGYLQLTGKSNYIAFSKHIGEDCVTNPDLVATKYPLESASWYFRARVSEKASLPLNSFGVKSVTAIVKGNSKKYKRRLKTTQIFGSIIDCTYTGKENNTKQRSVRGKAFS